jgi:hypothetical protein
MPGFPVFSKDNSGKRRKLPLTTNRAALVGEFLLGRNIATSRVNSAGAGANGSEVLVGNPIAPVYGDHQLELGNGAMLDTAVPATDAMTCLVACTGDVSSAQVFLGASVAASGRLNLLTGGASVVATLGNSNLALPGALSGPAADFRVLVARLGGTAAGSPAAIDEYRAGVRVQGAKTTLAGALVRQDYTRVIGGSSTIGAGAGYPVRNRFASYLHWSAYLSDADVLAAYLELRAVLAQMGKAI